FLGHSRANLRDRPVSDLDSLGGSGLRRFCSNRCHKLAVISSTSTRTIPSCNSASLVVQSFLKTNHGRREVTRANLLRSNRLWLRSPLLLLPVANRSADRIFSQYRAVDLHWRQRKLFHDLCVLDGQRLVYSFSLHPLGRER